MTEIINTDNGRINILTYDNIVELHNILTLQYSIFEGMEPISPSGVKSTHLLHSAVHRQKTGIDGFYKYNDVFLNCATLSFGIAKNHAFHNGNKRTALLALIKHLYINGYILKHGLKETELFELILSIVEDKLHKHYLKYKNQYNSFKFNILDEEINFKYLAFWLKKNTISRLKYVACEMKINDFRRIIESKDIEYKESGKQIVLTKYRKKLFGLAKEVEIKHKYTIGKFKNTIKKKLIEKIRKDFNLSSSDGIDSVLFYNEDTFIQDELYKYKSLIYRLSKT